MKKILSILFVATFIFSSCGYRKTSKEIKEAREAINDAAEELGVEGDFKEAKDCAEFVDQYEKWMNDYLDFLEEYLKNPMDAAKSQEYMKLAQEGLNWVSQWNGKFIHCASKEKYQKRFNEISEKAEKRLKDMGLN